MEYVKEYGALIGALAAVLTTIITLYIWRRGRMDKARSAFRAAFAKELCDLRELCVTDFGQVWEILSAAYPKHEAAYIEYRNFLGFGLQKLWLSKRWMRYRGPYPKPPELPSEDKRYRLSHHIGVNLEEEENKRINAIDLITKVIT